MFLLGVLFMVLGVGASIALHEIGHLTPAKKFGVKVTQYMVGFGPTLWSKRKGETEYGVKAIPLGGYIRMIGMFPPRPEDEVLPDGTVRVRASSTGRFSQMVDEARSAAYEEVSPADRHRVFYDLPTYKKVIIMFGGPFMNLVIAGVLLTIVACGIGLPAVKAAKIYTVQPCLTTTATTCAEADRSPAAKAGLKDGDQFVSVGGKPVTTGTEAINTIRAHGNQPVEVVVLRGGQQVSITVTPVLKTMDKIDAEGSPVLNWKGQRERAEVGVIGASIGAAKVVDERRPLTDAPAITWDTFVKTGSVFVKIPQKMVGVVSAAFGSGERDVNGPVSVVGVGRIAGEVADIQQITLMDKFAMLLMMLAALNMALFVFNLVPLLPLDGGHIATALWEAVKRPIQRARGVTGRIYADAAKGMPIAYGVSLVLIVMFVLLAYADIVNPVKLGN
ncbi:M50 family metallopeptidase [Calidifontibacter indicus]|uniref:Membrane-associated protease RseP (Regulator of RpoE activity) n=1 Tax=Calidifontibacter indicus TaxID=419650 RepID=A0A3D9UMN4_9MICO|nr:site-2 protease family protein [Calidifontibacter indicus]REF30718.1 membrane-associated protease RseP (regulator of RpoE activity) [Calidifontibacter indicus]